MGQDFEQTIARRNRRAGLALAAVAASMVGLAFASVPLYQLFCQVTGYAGTPGRADSVQTAVGDPQSAPVIEVRFNADIARDLPWKFKPEQKGQMVHLGEEALAFFRSENKSSQSYTGTATFNVTPLKAAEYFIKTECFCFTEQTLAPGEVADMPVTYYVDPAIRDDPNTRDVTSITLSYTFFPKKQSAEISQQNDERGG